MNPEVARDLLDLWRIVFPFLVVLMVVGIFWLIDRLIG